MSDEDDDELDGICDVGSQPTPVDDEDVDALVLFADVAGDREAVEQRRREWEELFRST